MNTLEKQQRLCEKMAALTPAQQQHFKQQLVQKGIAWPLEDSLSENALVPVTTTASRPDRMPLSASQLHFWVLQQLFPQSSAYHIAFSWHFSGNIDQHNVLLSLQAIIDRHEPLRSFFPESEGEPYQALKEQLTLSLEPVSVTPQNLEATQQAVANKPLSLSEGPLFRIALLSLSDQEHRLVVVLHHIIADGWSRGIFIREFLSHYQQLCQKQTPTQQPLTMQYSDYVLAQREWLASDDFERQRRHWVERLQGIDPLELPCDYPRSAQVDMSAATYQCQLPADLSDALNGLSRQLGATVFMVMLAAFKLLLHRYSGQRDISVGIPSAGRTDENSGQLIGFFVNTLCLRTVLKGDPSFDQWLTAVKSTLVDAMENQALPFAHVVDALDLPRSANQNPLFQTLFQLQTQSYQLQNAQAPELGIPGLTVEQSLVELSDTKFELSWHMGQHDDGFMVAIEYRKALFCAERIEQMVMHYETLLRAIIAAPKQAISGLTLLDTTEQQGYLQLMVSTQQARMPLSKNSCIGNFEYWVTQRGEQIALRFQAQSLTYEGLNERVNQLAHYLQQHLGERGAQAPRIAFCLERSCDMVVALLAIMKVGATYIPLDPTHPAERLAYILASADTSLLLTRTLDTKGLVDNTLPCPVVTLDTISDELLTMPRHNLCIDVTAESLAYIMFTSGSTGKPKGVPIAQASLFNLLQSMAHTPGLKAGDCLLAVTTVAFDIATLELLLPLVVGAELHVADRASLLDPEQLAQCLSTSVTHMQATPATWRLLIESGWQGHHKLTALCGGEALPIPLAKALYQRCAAVWNMYGPTETTIWSMVLKLAPQHFELPSIPLGEVIDQTQCYVLDEQGALAPTGIPGELYIGGAGLSPGYWQRPDLTENVFIAQPFAQAQALSRHLYRTGDRVCRDFNGNLLYLGRADFQIKHRGYRIEPGEIETLLCQQSEIKQSVVTIVTTKEVAQLVAYVTVDQFASVDQETLIQQLRLTMSKALPHYMQPQAYVLLETFALNTNGKIDRKALPAPVLSTHKPREYRGPSSPMEKAIQAVWKTVLQREPLSVDDNFFDLGGDSIIAMRIAAQARKAGIVITAVQLFEHQTIAEQAQVAQCKDSLNDTLRAPNDREKAYWQSVCQPVAPLPCDPIVNHDGESDEAVLETVLTASRFNELQGLCQQYVKGNIESMLLTALTDVLSQWCQQSAWLIHVPLDNTTNHFVPCRIELPQGSIKEKLVDVQQRWQQTQQEGPFYQHVKSSTTQAQQLADAQSGLTFNLCNDEGDKLPLSAAQKIPGWIVLDCRYQGRPGESALTLHWRFDAHYYQWQTIQGLARRLVSQLQSMCVQLAISSSSPSVATDTCSPLVSVGGVNSHRVASKTGNSKAQMDQLMAKLKKRG